MDFLLNGFRNFHIEQGIMILVGLVLIYLAVKKELEPSVLLPLGFGAILVNLPLTGVINNDGEKGIIEVLYNVGIDAPEILPLLLFIGIGAMIDFGPLLANPKLIFIGAAAQLGIFVTIILASLLGFSINDAASIGIIGAADGPTSIFVANKLGSNYLAAITVAAYCYMALVPIIQPAAVKLVTTKKERLIRMDYNPQGVTKTTRVLFPIIVTILAGFIAPQSLALVGFLMFGNLIRECGVLDSLKATASDVLTNLVTILLGISIAFKMHYESFVSYKTLIVIGLGLFAFVFDTIGGCLFVKFINLFTKKKINPMVGAAGISAFPMASRVVQKMGLKEDPTNHLLMHAASANVAGQIASALAGGAILGILL